MKTFVYIYLNAMIVRNQIFLFVPYRPRRTKMQIMFGDTNFYLLYRDESRNSLSYL